MKTITVDIDIDGNVTIETKGFSGAECKKATAALETALGKVTSDAPTHEFYTASPKLTLKTGGAK